MLVAVSSCLLGNPVRYDGRTKKNDYILNRLGDYCQFYPVCPEHKAFGTPRETIHIEIAPHDSQDSLKVRQNVHKADVTAPLRAVIDDLIIELKESGVCGVILKSNSPSCGYGSAPRFANGIQYDFGDGLFADAILKELPYLPIIEESGFNNSWKRDQFLIHLFSYARIEQFCSGDVSRESWYEFHQNQRLLLSLKNQSLLDAMDELLSASKTSEITELLANYIGLFKQAIASTNTALECANIMQYLIQAVTSAAIPTELLKTISHFQYGEISICTLMASVSEYFNKVEVDDYQVQSLLTPYPQALAIRTH